jgi:hypothetical protein
MSAPMGTPPPPPPVPAPVAGSNVCPKCRTPNSPSSKFCAACGASLSPSPPPVAGAPPPPVVDIRQKVDQDRGFLKKLQLLLPGFRGYRQGEDDRAADSLLRMQVADRVHRASGIVTTARASLTNSGDFVHLTDLAQIISELNVLEGQIRHAEQGYSGISPSVRMSVTSLDKLYEYDYGFVQAADTLTETIAPLNVPAPSTTDAASAIQGARAVIRQLQAAFQARTKAVQGIQV